MDKHVLLGAAAAVTLAASGAFAGSNTVLWDQNANFGNVLMSQSDGSGNDTAAADDFVVPSGQTWHVAQLDVTGVYFNGSGPAKSELVTFYTDKDGKPGRVYRGPFTLKCSDPNFGSFQCIFPKPVKLGTGTYWVSLVANMDFSAGGEWGWFENTVVHGNEAVYRSPGQGSKCQKFRPLHVCGGGQADMAFDLVGTAN